MPRGGEVIRIRLQLNLRAMKFRPGAGGENRIVGWLGDRRGGNAAKENKRDEPPAGFGRTLCFRRHYVVN
jgi:hypothetical protein